MFMVIVTCFALSVSPMVEGMMTSLLMKNAMDIANKVEGAGVEFDKVMQIMMVLLGLYLLKTASQSVTTITLTNSIQNAMHDLRNALQDKIRKLPVSYFDTHQYGDILSRITNDVDTLSNALQQTLTEMIRGTLMLILAIIMMFNINVFMTFVVLLIIPAALFITKVIVKRSQRKFQAQQMTLRKLMELLQKCILAIMKSCFLISNNNQLINLKILMKIYVKMHFKLNLCHQSFLLVFL